MDERTIVEKFNGLVKLAKIIKKSRVNRIKIALIKSCGVFAVAIVLSIALKFGVIAWIVALSGALAISIFGFKLHMLLKNYKVVVGIINGIQHDYYTGIEKGTGGFSQVHTYTSIQQLHNIVIALEDLDGLPLDTNVVCSSRFEKHLKVGDVILYHPELRYPANLSNITTCICMNCGAMQDAEHIICQNCEAELCNRKTIS